MATYDVRYLPGSGNLGGINILANQHVLLGVSSDGVILGQPTSPTHLTILPTGSVYNDDYNLNVIAIQFSSGSITNFGSITGMSSYTGSGYFEAIRFSQGGTLTNYGMIVGETFAVRHRSFDGAADQSVTNAGMMTAATVIWSENGTATIVNTGSGSLYATDPAGKVINKTGGTLLLTNAGTIDGDIVAVGGNDSVTNTGQIQGNIDLGAGNDTVINNGLIQGNVTLGAGDDSYGGVGRMEGTLSGGDGNDTLTGGIYDDVLNGGANNDVLIGGSGTDVMTGGTGNDTFHVDSAYDRVIEAASGGTDTVYTTVSYGLRAGQEIENLSVNPGADYADIAINLTGNEFANTLTGNAAANKLNGKAGADTMIGGDGDDIYYVDDDGDVVLETANHGSDTVYTTVSHALFGNVETLRAQGSADVELAGNNLNNTIVGNDGANYIDGGMGADEMAGGAGNDTYLVADLGDTVVERADGGNDTVVALVSFALGKNIETLSLIGVDAIDGTGNSTANAITGNGAANTIAGMGGFDTLTGNEGADTFVFSTKLDAAINLATITDFEHGVDRIALDTAFRRVGTTGPLEEQFFTASAPTTRDHHILYDQATGVLSYDLDGSGVRPAIAFAQITPDTVLDYNDFLIV